MEVLQRDAGRCRYCRLQQTGQAAVFHVDNIVPRSRGGSTTIENLVLQCPYCSLHKSNKIAGIVPETGVEVSLFSPLQEQWAEHFTFLADGTCAGLTPTGRAAVEALRM